MRHTLPIYPHVKTIQSDAEGMEVANLLGDSRAMLLLGHGAVTTGKSLSEAVMGMAQLEEQARMNYLAYCAQGKDYTYLRQRPHSTRCQIARRFTSSRTSKTSSKAARRSATVSGITRSEQRRGRSDVLGP